MQIRIAENIRKYRKERGMTQERLSEILGVTVGAVSKWEAGASTPELGLIVEMADFFETSVDVLLGYGWHSGSMGEAVDNIRRLRNAKDFDGASAAAEKALERYPNGFELVFQCAVMYALKGMEQKNQKAYRRSLELYERSLELLAQNDDPKINEWSIQNYIAQVYLALGQTDRALELMKRNNVDGLNNAEIGYTLATRKEAPDEALGYLSDALLDNVTQLMYIVGGYGNAYEQQGDYVSALAISDWLQKLLSGLQKPEGGSYLDRMMSQLLSGCALLALGAGDEAGARSYLERAKAMALRFDAAPNYGFTEMRFYRGSGMGTGFDDFGDTAMDGIRNTIMKEEKNGKRLMTIWEELNRE